MPPIDPKKPANLLETVKQRVADGDIDFTYYNFEKDPLRTAFLHFGWREDKIKKALLRLNDKYHRTNPEKHHFDEWREHKDYPDEDTFMDYYKAYNLMEGCDVYTHFHIRESETRVMVSSFHQLD